MTDQEYCLRWNNHQPNFISVFKSLLELEELVDVTLSVEGKHIKAHKVILSACSPYFKLLFTITPSKHPIIILNDIKFVDLKTIIDFMYCGEVNVSDDQLADILEVAELLQVRGLYDPNKKTGTLEKNHELSAKRRKRKSEIFSADNAPQTNVASEQTFENVSLSTSGADRMFDPTDWLAINDDSVKCELNYEQQPNVSVQDCEIVPNTSTLDQNNSVGHYDPTATHLSPHITRPGPGRRRNAKVQESENFLLALEAVRSGSLGFCKAAKLYGLNNRTLWLEYKKRGYPSTRPPVGLKHRTNALTANPS